MITKRPVTSLVQQGAGGHRQEGRPVFPQLASIVPCAKSCGPLLNRVASLTYSEQIQRELIGLPSKVLLQRGRKDIVFRCDQREQGHGGVELEIVGIAEDLFD